MSKYYRNIFCIPKDLISFYVFRKSRKRIKKHLRYPVPEVFQSRYDAVKIRKDSPLL